MTKNVVTLPESEQRELIRLHEARDLVGLRQYVLALRMAHWPMRAIGDPVNAPRSTVAMWENSADPTAFVPSVPECPRAEKARGERTIRRRKDVPISDRKRLRELAEEARLVRGKTPKDSPARIAADELDAKITAYMNTKVPVKRIADHMGVTPRAVMARHERHVSRTESADA